MNLVVALVLGSCLVDFHFSSWFLAVEAVVLVGGLPRRDLLQVHFNVSDVLASFGDGEDELVEVVLVLVFFFFELGDAVVGENELVLQRFEVRGIDWSGVWLYFELTRHP